MLVWQRRGVLVMPSGDDLWSTHAQAPTVMPLTDELWRVYFAGRDPANRAAIFAADVEPHRAMRVVRVYDRPLLGSGPPQGFDEDGVGPACALRDGARIMLYYVGISSPPGAPNRHAIGLAVSDDGLAFERLRGEAIFAPGDGDPYSTSIPYVGRTAEGFEMWYHSTTGWYHETGRREATYTIRHAVSNDGIRWARSTGTALHREGSTTPSTRPWVAAGRLWFSRRGLVFRDGAPGAYRIVSAPLEEQTGCATARAEPIRFANPPERGDWDGEMQAYASIAPSRDRLMMFYNGNGFGAQGFGWAEAALS